ncbi:DUF5109 domain-containing protein [Paenibacillus psychroresistens]|uniref:DUF5109 domain-containing protein n=1 Tax=Paenibacillus psychroresistens TaxID=1778678 RepID=A0A6B8RC53_9BACL|nr:DUF4434 domain-containing protein [Paenibacillus psychroresistens]QGQ93909.1 DUF5109 domain-containing protein [Paenibacillus psychroresistens]
MTVARPTTQLWSDAETFNGDFKPMDLNVLLADMNAAKPYVTKFLSFSFNHYISPQQVNPFYYTTYKNYVNSGVMDSTIPTTPTSLTAVTQNVMTINLNWSAATDNTGVVGYKIYRNSELVWTAYTNGTSFVDTQLNAGTLYSYTIQAFDAAGNNSGQSSSASATTSAATSYPTNLALSKTYTTTIPADTAYPDSGGELTNGVYDGTIVYQNAAFQGRNTGSLTSFTIDLGTSQSIKELTANFLQIKTGFIFLPNTVTFSVSPNNTTFTQVGSVITKPAVSAADQNKIYRLTNLTGITGRYVKIDLLPGSSAWTFMDEIQVRQ